MFTNETQAHSTDALRQKAFDALYRGDVDTARAAFVIEGAREVPAAVLQWTQNRLEELVKLRKENNELLWEHGRLKRQVRELEEALNPPDPEPEDDGLCPSCGSSLF